MALMVKATPQVVANKWDDEPVGIYIPGLDQDFPPEQALALATAIAEKATLALAGKYDHHYEGENGEEVD